MQYLCYDVNRTYSQRRFRYFYEPPLQQPSQVWTVCWLHVDTRNSSVRIQNSHFSDLANNMEVSREVMRFWVDRMKLKQLGIMCTQKLPCNMLHKNWHFAHIFFMQKGAPASLKGHVLILVGRLMLPTLCTHGNLFVYFPQPAVSNGNVGQMAIDLFLCTLTKCKTVWSA